VHYLREILKEGLPLPPCQWLPWDAVHIGAPPHGVEVYNVIGRWLGGIEHPDPNLQALAELVEILGPNQEDADDDDLVHWQFMSMCQPGGFKNSGDGRRRWSILGSDDRTPKQKHQERSCIQFVSRYMTTYSSVKTVVLNKHSDCSPFDRTWLVYELILAAYCQRIVNAGDPEVKRAFSPKMLTSPVQMIRDGVASGQMRMSFPEELDRYIIPTLKKNIKHMVPVLVDKRGFEAFCSNSQIAWIKVGYLRRFSKLYLDYRLCRAGKSFHVDLSTLAYPLVEDL